VTYPIERSDLRPNEVMDINHDLLKNNIIRGRDYEFAIYRTEDHMGWRVEYRFFRARDLTWFVLKYPIRP